LRLLYVVSHPIQYQAPLLRRIAADPEISLLVAFERDFSSRRYRDEGFGVDIEWDVPLRDGYESRLMDEIDWPRELARCDALWVHGWESPRIRAVIAQAHALGRPVLMRGENWDGAMPDGPPPRGWIKRWYLRRIFSQCRVFLAIGTANRAYYEARGVAPERIFLMPYAVDNDYFAARATAAAAVRVRERHNIARGRKILLFAGKLTRRKRAGDLIAAWRRAEWLGEPPVLLVVGDGELRADLEGRASLDLIFAGFRNQSEMPAYYAAADLFALISEREPWGLAVNEAMACGTGVVVSDQVGAGKDLVTAESGRIVATGDVAALAASLPALMAQSESLGEGARRRIAGWDFAADHAALKQALGSLA
jgi:glycosyltransferase involved in cell wall biosynthesis